MMAIKATDDRVAYRPGDRLEVEASWELDAPPTVLVARLVWRTTGWGDPDEKIVEETPAAVVEAQGHQRFHFRLPDGPYSFIGHLIVLVWFVELVADNEVERFKFTLGHEDRAIVLPEDKVIAFARAPAQR